MTEFNTLDDFRNKYPQKFNRWIQYLSENPNVSSSKFYKQMQSQNLAIRKTNLLKFYRLYNRKPEPTPQKKEISTPKKYRRRFKKLQKAKMDYGRYNKLLKQYQSKYKKYQKYIKSDRYTQQTKQKYQNKINELLQKMFRAQQKIDEIIRNFPNDFKDNIEDELENLRPGQYAIIMITDQSGNTYYIKTDSLEDYRRQIQVLIENYNILQFTSILLGIFVYQAIYSYQINQ